MRTLHNVSIGLAAVVLVSCASVGMATRDASTGPLAQEVRRATQAYQDVAAATATGDAPFLGCVTSPQGGAMGIHYVNSDLVGDGKLQASRPEALMYQPRTASWSSWASSTSSSPPPGRGDTTRTGCSQTGIRRSRARTMRRLEPPRGRSTRAPEACGLRGGALVAAGMAAARAPEGRRRRCHSLDTGDATGPGSGGEAGVSWRSGVLPEAARVRAPPRAVRATEGPDMTEPAIEPELSAEAHARTMREYIRDGEARAFQLGNRGPLRMEADGSIARDILQAYWRCGFYVFEGVIGTEELEELRADVERVLAAAPVAPGAKVDALGRPAIGAALARPSFSFARPLSDPLGGTGRYQGRHPVKMQEPTPGADAPDRIVELLLGNLQIMDSCLRLYGHPGLLTVAEAVNGPDFVPFNEVVFVKDAGLGVSVAWHRDGTTHWTSPDFHPGAHGFNFMAQLYGSTPGNGVWVLPGSHVPRWVDIEALVTESGSERIRGAVPMVCRAGDVIISNRQLVHGSFANTSPDRRVTVNFGILPRGSVLNVTTAKLDGQVETYDAARLHQRSRMIAIAIDARHRRFPHERRYVYRPLLGEEDANRWSEEVRETVVKNYNVLDVHI